MFKRFILLMLIILFPIMGMAETMSLVRVHFDANTQLEDMLEQGYNSAMCVMRTDYSDFFVPAREVADLEATGFNVEVLHPDMEAYVAERIPSRDDMGQYHTYAETADELQAIHTAFPDITHLISISQSWDERDIWAMKISDNPTEEEDEAELLITGVHHSREIITVEIALYFINYLTENYATDEEVQFFVDNREIWVVPMLNPDGHYVVEEIYNYWRKNTRDNNNNGYFDTSGDGVDLNRNYGYMWGYDNTGSSPSPSSETYRGPSAFSEPETQAIRDFCEEHEFSIAMNFHSYGRLLLIPWGYMPQNTPDHDTYMALAERMVANNGYEPGNGANGVIYPTNGSSDDWMYGEQDTKPKILAFTPEVGTEFLPPESQIPGLINETFPINYLAMKYAANPQGFDPPAMPVLDAMGGDEDGDYTISWSTPEPDPINPALYYDLREKSGMSIATDDAESGDNNWDFGGFEMSTDKASSGSYSFYSGNGINIDHSMTTVDPIQVEADMVLTFKAWYNTHFNDDFAYVSVSTDGANFINIPGNITTDVGFNNEGNGITGNSYGWVDAEFDLSAYAGELIYLRFRMVTNTSVSGFGIYVDDIYPVVDFANDILLGDKMSGESFEVTGRDEGSYIYMVRAWDSEYQTSGWSGAQEMLVGPLSVEDDDDAVAAVPFALQQNYPNPFNPATTIGFSLSETDGVNLRIFDVSGQLVRVVLDQQMDRGTHTVQWNGTNDGGQQVASGIYFYELKTDQGFADRKSMLLLK